MNLILKEKVNFKLKVIYRAYLSIYIYLKDKLQRS